MTRFNYDSHMYVQLYEHYDRLKLGGRGGGRSNSKPPYPKVTVRQFSGYCKVKSIYVKNVLLFKVIGGMAIILKLLPQTICSC